MSDVELGGDVSRFDRIKAESEQICPVCQQVLWLSFYFDGFGFSKETGPASNIIKLYKAAYNREENGMLTYYYPGLGADFYPETRVLAEALADKAIDDTRDKVTDAVKDKAQETVQETVTDAWSRSQSILNNSLPRRAVWTAGEVWDEGVEAVSKMGHQVKRTLNKPRHPWRAAKSAAQTGAKASAGYVAESWGRVRDASLVAALFNTGVDSRLKTAERDFRNAVRAAQARLPIHKINVAVFGYDMGGGLALAFAKRLLEEIAPGGLYNGIAVHIKFMGLFDCVTNRYDDNVLTGFMPLSNQVSSELLLSPKIECCVHYAAAHELRFYKPLSMIGADPEDYGGPRQERLFPGSQVDVGGGAEEEDKDENGEEVVCDKLSRLPLQMMYHRAYAAGIPMPSLTALEETDARLHQTFIIPPEIAEFQRSYRATVKKLVATTREIPSLILQSGGPVERFKPQINPVDVAPYQCTVPVAPQFITQLPQTIEEELSGHTVIFIHWLRMWFDQNEDRAGRITQGWGLGVPLDRKAYGRYQKLADELLYLRRNARFGPQFDQAQANRQLKGEVKPDIFVSDPQGQALYWLWNNPGTRVPEIETLYPHFINDLHDSMAESDIEAILGDLVHARHYMNQRAVQKLATEPDPRFLDRLELAYEKFFGD